MAVYDRYFARPSVPQTGWMGKVPLGLLEVSDFYAAWHSETQSFRTADSPADRFLSFQTWEQPGWIGKAPLNLWEVPFYAATVSQSGAFEVRGYRDRAYVLQTQPQIAWIAENIGTAAARIKPRMWHVIGWHRIHG